MSEKIFSKIKDYSKKNGGDLLEDRYLGYYTPMKFIDSDGNEFESTWQRMSDNRSFSPHQKTKNKQRAAIKTTIGDLKEFAMSFGGDCLSTEYLGQNCEYKWVTKDGDQFSRTWKYVRKSWGLDKRGKHFSKWSLESVLSWCSSKGAEFLSENYTTMDTYYKFKDRNGNVFSQKFSTCLYNDDVLHCVRSRGESEIEDFLISLNIEYVKNATKILDNSRKEIDFWIPSLNVGIEYHGLYWHTTDSTTTPCHIKQKLASEKGIQLIQIFEHEWKDRKDQVKSFLKSKLGKNVTYIGARKCQIREVDKSEAKEFFSLYHIQGYASCKKIIGLFYNEELVCAASFSTHHRNGKDLVLSRFVGKTGVSVPGGLSRICKNAAIELGSFITWVDLRWSSGKSWESIGWRKESQLSPDYFYLDPKTNKIISKQSRKKSNVNTPLGMTESEHAKLDGLKTIKDAGKLRLRF